MYELYFVLFRHKVWNFLERSRQLFQNEHTTVHFESGDFQLSSFIYFENSMVSK